MAEEFKIKSKIELDTKEADKKWKQFKEDKNKLEELNIKVNLNTNKVFKSIKQIHDELNKIKNIDIKFNIESNNKNIQDIISGYKKTLNNINKEADKINKNSIKLPNFLDELHLTDKDSKEIIAKYKDTFNTIKKLNSQLNKSTNDNSSSKILTDIDELTNKLEKLKSKIKNNSSLEIFNFKQDNSDIIKNNKNINDLINNISKVEKTFNSINFKNVDTTDIESKINDVLISIEKLYDKSKDKINIDLDIGNVRNEIDDINNQINNLKTFDSLKSKFNSLEDSIRNTLGSNYADKLISDLYELESAVINVDGSFDRLANGMKNSLSDATSDIKKVQNELKEVSKISSSGFVDNFKSSFSAYTLGDIAGDTVINTVRGITDAYMELDSAMTNIKKVADEDDINSVEKLDNIKNKAIEISKEVGKSSSEVTNAIADTVQAGIGSMETSIEVAKQTMMLANVGDIDQETASSSVNTMINGFNIDAVNKFKKEINGVETEVTQLTTTMDALNHASNNYGTDTQKLLDGLQNGATVLGSYGVSVEDTIALMTTGIEVLGNGNKVGRMLPTINSAKSVN